MNSHLLNMNTMVVPKTVPVVRKAQTDVTLAALRVCVPANDILCDIWTRKISIGTDTIFFQPAIPVTGLGVFIWLGLDVHIITDWGVIGLLVFFVHRHLPLLHS